MKLVLVYVLTTLLGAVQSLGSGATKPGVMTTSQSPTLPARSTTVIFACW